MKNQLWLLLALLLTMIHVQGQNVTKSFTWQGIIKDNAGNPVTNQSVNIKIGIREGINEAGNYVYIETHQVTTSATGQVGLEVGGGQASFGNFESINWTANNHFQEVEIDITGGSNFQSLGNSPIRPIPLAINVLNEKETIKTVTSNNYQSVETERYDLINVREYINLNSDYYKLNENYTCLYGGGFIGTDNPTIRFGYNAVVTNMYFKDVVLDGSNVTFHKCRFEGNITFSPGAKLNDCEVEYVTQPSGNSISIIEHSSIRGSTLQSVELFINSKIDNCTLGNIPVAPIIEHSTIENSTLQSIESCTNSQLYSCTFESGDLIGNYMRSCKIEIGHSYITLSNNSFEDTKINVNKDITEMIISNNRFKGIYNGESNMIEIDVSYGVQNTHKITDNTFYMHSSTPSSISIYGNKTTGTYLLDITDNTFSNGQKAVSFTSNFRSKVAIIHNKLLSTIIGVSDNGSYLRVFDNITF